MENILLPVEISKQNKLMKMAEVRKWLARFDLSDYENAYPHELSGGMRQRAAFLRTIMTNRDLLLLD